MPRDTDEIEGFKDRRDAGERLAEMMHDLDDKDVVVLALPRGGVPVARPVADALQAPLDVFIARKIGAPHNPEAAIGAIAEGGQPLFDKASVAQLRLSSNDLETLVSREQDELERRVQRYRAGRPLPPMNDRTVLLVDDGIATGMTVEAAATALRQRDPAALWIAAPVGSHAAVSRLEKVADRVVCALVPDMMWAISQWYEYFDQTTDEEVEEILSSSRREAGE